MNDDPILALDLSTRVGWAVGTSLPHAKHGVWILPKGGLDARCSALANALADAIAVFSPSLVVIEAPLPPQAQTAANSARLQFGLDAVAKMTCFELGVPHDEARAQWVRKTVLGSGRADKDAAVAWCRSQGLEPADHNAADALVLLRFALLGGINGSEQA